MPTGSYYFRDSYRFENGFRRLTLSRIELAGLHSYDFCGVLDPSIADMAVNAEIRDIHQLINSCKIFLQVGTKPEHLAFTFDAICHFAVSYFNLFREKQKSVPGLPSDMDPDLFDDGARKRNASRRRNELFGSPPKEAKISDQRSTSRRAPSSGTKESAPPASVASDARLNSKRNEIEKAPDMEQVRKELEAQPRQDDRVIAIQAPNTVGTSFKKQLNEKGKRVACGEFMIDVENEEIFMRRAVYEKDAVLTNDLEYQDGLVIGTKNGASHKREKRLRRKRQKEGKFEDVFEDKKSTAASVATNDMEWDTPQMEIVQSDDEMTEYSRGVIETIAESHVANHTNPMDVSRDATSSDGADSFRANTTQRKQYEEVNDIAVIVKRSHRKGFRKRQLYQTSKFKSPRYLARSYKFGYRRALALSTLTQQN